MPIRHGGITIDWPSPFEPLGPNFSLFALWRWNEMPFGALRRCGPILS